MKEIVSKETIPSDPCLMLVKAFRIANKRAGEAKRENNAESYNEWCGKLRYLAQEAEGRSFKIWVNENGKTGHTYGKDYKPSLDAENDWEAYSARATERMNAMMGSIGEIVARRREAENQAPDATGHTPDDVELDNEPETPES